jgi:TusA-related sulfurtransferase
VKPDDGTTPDLFVDTRGSFCPVPIIKLSEAIGNIDEDGIVELVSDDAAIELDLPAWCRSTGHRVVSERRRGGVYTYRVRKSARGWR